MATCRDCECYTRCTSEWHKLNKVENVCGHFKNKSVWFGLRNKIKFWFIRTFKTRNCRTPKGETKFIWLGENNEK